MSEIAIREDRVAAVAAGPNVTVAALADWAQQLDAAMRIARALCNTSFVPKHFQGKPEEAAAAILTGNDLGMPPMASLRSFHVINGKPDLYAEVKVAILAAHGHRVWTDLRTDEAVTVSGCRKGQDRVETITITIEQAKRAGWTTNATYAKTPQDMLWARAAARVCKLVAPELLHGINGLEEFDEPAPMRVQATLGGPVTAAEILGAAEVEDGEPRPAGGDEPAVTAPGITTAQQRKMHALLTKTGRGERAVGLVYIAGVIGREVDSSKELTAAEAVEVIAALERDEPDRGTQGGEDALWPDTAQVPADPAVTE